MRGIDLIHVPTTILAQVDSSIGGKNGVNLEVGKNLVGTTYQPRVVISDVDFITTLPEREALCGFGEVVKYGLLAGDDFMSFLEMNRAEIVERNPRSLAIMHIRAVASRPIMLFVMNMIFWGCGPLSI